MSATLGLRHAAYEVAGRVVFAVAAAARAASKAEAPADATPTEQFLAWTGRQLPSASAVLRQGHLPLGRR